MRNSREWQRRVMQYLIVMIVVWLVLSVGSAVQGQERLTPVTAAAVSTHWSVTLGPAVALSKGYWREQGLDVKFTVVGPAATHVAAFAGGSFQFSINLTTDTMARAATRGARIYAIMGSTNQNQYVLFGRSEIKRIADLKGKRIAIDTVGGPMDFFSQRALSTVGLGVRDVVLVPVAGTIEVRVNAMLAGATDATVASISQWPMLRPQGINLLFRMRSLYPDWQTAVNGAHGDILEKNPAAVKGFIKGMIRAYQFMKDTRNNAELLQIAKDAKITVEEQQWGEALAIQRDFWPADGALNVKGTELVLQRERDDGRISKDFTLEKFIRLKPLEEAQRELGLRP
jgi:ABC-type nitrate/sulfonate/bicarbonate transport system substrate-binding protein